MYLQSSIEKDYILTTNFYEVMKTTDQYFYMTRPKSPTRPATMAPSPLAPMTAAPVNVGRLDDVDKVLLTAIVVV